jgi:LacI family transcriptional regulator
MRDIARRLGVSRPAVSAALSDRPYTIALSLALRDRIRRAATDMGYRRNFLAQSFIKQRSYLVGFLGRREYFLYAYETLSGIESVLDEKGCSVLAFLHGDTPEDQGRHLQRCLDRRVDGLIVAGAPEGRRGRIARPLGELQAKGLPIVQVYRRLYPGIPVVMVDDGAIGALATRHLIDLGHRRIVHYTYDDYIDRLEPGRNRDARERYEGYARTMREAGLEPAVATFPTSRYHPLSGGHAPGAASEAASVLSPSARFTAAVCFNDYVALGLLKGVRALGRRVPEDLSIVGYDDIDLSRAAEPPLTTLAPPVREIGREAAARILDLIEGRPVKDLVFRPALLSRDSTARRAGGTP